MLIEWNRNAPLFYLLTRMDLKTVIANVDKKLGIASLNEMQRSMLPLIDSRGHVVLYSHTGSGKTLAFLVPLVALIEKKGCTQGLIVAPTREIALQTGDVLRKLSLGLHCVVCYGGHSIADEVSSLKSMPDVIVATPGRLVDLLHRGVENLKHVEVLVLDEFDKVLELGFADDVDKLAKGLPQNLKTVILTSATRLDQMPGYGFLSDVKIMDFLKGQDVGKNNVSVAIGTSDGDGDKLDVLADCLYALQGQKNIVFANQRDTVEQIYDFLRRRKFCCEFLHGKLTQLEREKAIALFENGTYDTLVTTDLGARGIDFKDVDNVIHFECPVDEESYTHRNGRTGRYGNGGNVFVLQGGNNSFVPDYAVVDRTRHFDHKQVWLAPKQSTVQTIHFKAGRKEKISKKDILGFLLKNLGVQANAIGVINVYDHYSLAAIKGLEVKKVLGVLNAKKIKGLKVRVTKSEFDCRHKLG